MNGARGTCVGMEGEGDSEKLLVTLEPQEGAASGTPPKTVKVQQGGMGGCGEGTWNAQRRGS